MLKQLIAVTLGILAGDVAAAQHPEPDGPFMVFFDWGKPDMRGDDAATLDQVAALYRAHPGARLQLSGHTDRSGSVATNRRAGLSRAEAVRNQLVARGVSPGAMSIISYGEEQPLVPTEDGVREVQNRRVEIRIQE